MNRPNFFVIGAAKCGTTSVCDLLAAHPDVFMSTPKEPHYLSRLVRYRELRSWYFSLFDEAQHHRAIGEGSTSYSHPHRIHFVAPRLHDEFPDARIIYMVRHPVRRLESDWKMRLREGRVPESIVDAIETNASLVTFGLYWDHLSRYRELFPDEQLLVVFLEDLAEDPTLEVSRIYRHVGVDPSYTPDNPQRQRNASSDYREDGRIAGLLRNVPMFSDLKNAVPRKGVNVLKRILTREFEAVPQWNSVPLELIRGYYREDSRKLLQFCDKPEDFWSFTGEP